MAYAQLPTVVDGAVIQAAWGNQVKANFDAGPNALATAAGQLFYATATGVLVALPVGAPTSVLQPAGGAPAWSVAPTLSGLTVTPNGLTVTGGIVAAAGGLRVSQLSDGLVRAASGGLLAGAGTVQAGEYAPASIGQAAIADGAVSSAKLALGASAAPSAHAYKTANQTIPVGQQIVCSFDAELHDNNAIHDPAGNPTRLTCRTAGVYAVWATVALEPGMQGSTTAEWMELYLLLNGSAMAARTIAGPSGSFSYETIAHSRKLAVNDYVEVSVVNMTARVFSYRGVTPGPMTVPQLAMTLVAVG